MATGGTAKTKLLTPAPGSSILAVYDALREAGEDGLTRTQLVSKAKVSPRTLDRALNGLVDAGAKLDLASANVPGKRNYKYTLVKGPKWAEGVSHQARLAIQVAELLLETAGTEFWGHYLKVFEDLLAPNMTKKEEALFHQLKDQIEVRGPVASTGKRDANVFLKCLQALGGGKTPMELELTYRRAGEVDPSQVKVLPYCLTHDALAGSAYLLAWDLGELKVRHFRLSRITTVKAIRPRSFPSGTAPLLERGRKFQIGGWFANEEPFPIEVAITGENWVKAFLDTPPALPEVAVQDLSNAAGAKARVTFKATELEGPTRWILQLGPDAKVLSPDHLCQFVAGKLKAAAGRYS